jgi:hypothetical protein
VLLAAVQSTRVHMLQLGASDEPGPEAIGKLLTVVVAHPSAETLRDIRVGQGRSLSLGAQPGRGHLALDDVQPLSHLSGLRCVALTSPTVDPAGDAVAEMLAAWPALEPLQLGESSRLEIAELLAAARTHGALRELGCEVVVRAGAPPPDPHGFVHTDLQHMQLGFAGREAPAEHAAVAHLLAAVFPCMKDLFGWPWHMQNLMREGGRRVSTEGCGRSANTRPVPKASHRATGVAAPRQRDPWARCVYRIIISSARG